jgi:hypothetical protein
MKNVVCLMAGLVMASASYAQNQKSPIQVFKNPDGSHLVVLQSPTADTVEAARKELSPAIKRLCDARPAIFGSHQFVADSTKGPFYLMQPLWCVPVTVVTDPKWRPTREQQHAILALTVRYVGLRDDRNHEEIRGLLAAVLPFDKWLAGAEKFNQASGKARHRTFEKVTWYNNHPKAHAPGIYAAVDFTGEFVNIGIYCGFVVWFQGEGQSTFRLLREEQNYISREAQEGMTATELAAARKRLGC